MRALKYLCPKLVRHLQEGLLMHGMLNFSEKEDITKFISENNIKILNLCHIPEEGRLKTLSFSSTDRNRVLEVLEFGERVDGSSLFSFIDPGKSDIYIMPQIGQAFVNPFAILPTLNILCDYLDEDGKPLEIAPQNVLARAEKKLQSSSGIVLKALAELEYYVFVKQQSEMFFPGVPDKNYHESGPFAKFEDLRSEVLTMLSIAGVPTKYGHGEVGRIFTEDNMLMEQHEIEFTPQNLPKMADTIAIAKWMIRNVCARHGMSVTFIPKVSLEHAGNGMHIHLCALRNGKNILVGPNGFLSTDTRKMIGGILKLAPSMAAFANPTPVSYLRFSARKESPMHICWSARNRLALVRIPLWWSFKKGERQNDCRETFEYRAPDAFANAYLLFAALSLAVSYGLEHAKEASKIAEDLHTESATVEQKPFETLPLNCSESAINLQKDRQFYEADGVFPKALIEKTVERLEAYKDKSIINELFRNPAEFDKLIKQYMHYG